MNYKKNNVDVKLFTQTVLMVSSAASVALTELDRLIIDRRRIGHDVDHLVRARRGLAAVAAIADYYQKGVAHEED